MINFYENKFVSNFITRTEKHLPKEVVVITYLLKKKLFQLLLLRIQGFFRTK